MNRLRIEMGPWGVHFDRGYGIGKRTGWSIEHNESFIVQLEPWLIVALWKTAVLMREYYRERRRRIPDGNQRTETAGR